MEGNKPILGYYNLRGWAGPIRLLLAYLEVDYEERLYPAPTPQTGQGEWGLDKYSLGLDFPNIPYWIDSFVKVTETKCILRHISRVFGRGRKLCGDSIVEKGRVGMLENVLWDMWRGLTQASAQHTDESKLRFLEEATRALALLDTFLGENQWAVGNRITYVDFLMYEVVYHYRKFDSKLLDPYPRSVSYLNRIEAIPNIKKYMESEKFISGPCFSYKFKSKL